MMDYISNKELILLQQKLINWSGQYKRKGWERYWDRQMEDCEILVDDIQIKSTVKARMHKRLCPYLENFILKKKNFPKVNIVL